jgi:hypothetical protein
MSKKVQQFTSDMKLGIQGDVSFTRIDKIPEGLKRLEPENGHLIVAHSETGHHHAFLMNDDVEVLEDPNDPLVAYLDVKAPVDLDHHRQYDTHTTVRFDPGLYKINRQKEHTPEGWRRVAD